MIVGFFLLGLFIGLCIGAFFGFSTGNALEFYFNYKVKKQELEFKMYEKMNIK